MTYSISFNCWQCGAVVEDVPLPLSRAEMCSSCQADLHACRQCEYYDKSKANACREPVAEDVGDKTRANFCGYLTIKTDISQQSSSDEADALGELFGVDAHESMTPSTNDAAKSALDDLFGLDGDKKEN